jgi:hypothetical protein
MRTIFVLQFCVVIALSAASQADDPIDFRRDIRPILSDKCFLCHGPDGENRKAGLRLDTQAGAHEDVIVPGSLDESELWQRISSDDADEVMPPPDSHKELSKKEIELVRRWILDGAKYEQHWAFRSPKSPAVPKVNAARFATHPIDAFVYARMRQAGLDPSPRAVKELLIRRVTLDLTGLPPTIAEIDAYVKDESPEAYEKVVDRLLASKRFGERMAVDWLDIARYGDTSVFHADGPRDMWRWRDWVVDAYNQNMPFDQFTIKQLAGDLLPNSTVPDQIATGFNRNNASTDEGGVIAEEFRVEYAVDRVKTTSMVWLGLSMECAQCHDHKYDPISQEEYFRFFAFFNQAADPGMQSRSGNQSPIVKVPDEKKLKQIPTVEAEIVACKKRRDALFEDTKKEFQKWESVARNRVKPTPADDMVAHFDLDGAQENKVADAVDTKIVAEIVGKPKFEPGRVGQALSTNKEVFIKSRNTGASFERTDPFSFGCWIYFEGKPSGSPIARMDDGNRHRGWDLFLHSDGRVEAHVIHSWPDNTANINGPGKLKPKTWHHLFVTYDGSSKAAGIRIYVDGRLINTKVQYDSLDKTIKTEVPFTIGRRTPGFIFNGRVDDVRIYDRELSDREVAVLAGSDPAAPLLAIDPAKRTPEQSHKLQQIYLQQENKEYQSQQKKIAELERKLNDLRKPLTTVMVMKDVPKMRQTYVLNRGQYDSPNKEKPVSPGVPNFLPAFAKDLPTNRLGMAKWLVDPKNPLTARVTVNRIWRIFFGIGIVKTAEDFGSQSQWPSHPQLLDWLATEFVANGWDTKHVIKQIVMSETYRQSSRLSADRIKKDPNNILLSRGPRFRLAGEFVRDQALAISGLLNPKFGGPAVKPYQPMGLWNEVSLNGNLRFKQDVGDKLYRRSLYTYWKRSAPPPAMTIFDAPTREKCTIRRGITNTPLQALVLMNDPQFFEAARVFAERIMNEGGETIDSKIEFAMRLATSRKPNRQTIQILKSVFENEKAVFAKDPAKAKKLLSVGDQPRDEKLDTAELAAWAIIGSMILNLDETITRG